MRGCAPARHQGSRETPIIENDLENSGGHEHSRNLKMILYARSRSVKSMYLQVANRFTMAFRRPRPAKGAHGFLPKTEYKVTVAKKVPRRSRSLSSFSQASPACEVIWRLLIACSAAG